MNDILKAAELRQVVQQLEARKATVQSLKNRAEFSRISVHLVQRPLPPIIDLGGGNDWAVWKPGRTALSVLRWLHRAAIIAGDAGIIFSMTMVPFSVVVLVLYVVLTKFCRVCGATRRPLWCVKAFRVVETGHE